MRVLYTGIAAAAFCLSASAQTDVFNQATQTEYWRGCVQQQGFDPYPIELTANNNGGFDVNYDGLCRGVHNPTVQDGFDAVERIAGYAGNCVNVALVTYQPNKDGTLSVDFWWREADGPVRGNQMARARLVRGQSGMSAPVCNPNEAVS